jgi:hypothetical protein
MAWQRAWARASDLARCSPAESPPTMRRASWQTGWLLRVMRRLEPTVEE